MMTSWVFNALRLRSIVIAIGVTVLLMLLGAHHLYSNAMTQYRALESPTVYDRHGEEIALLPNARDSYARFTDTIPRQFTTFLVKKEDQQFWWHPGFNPWRTMRGIAEWFGFVPNRGSSTITQQLAKTLLGQEQSHSLADKSEELLYAVSLELFTSKKELLRMYANTVSMGNNIQGITEASKTYFGIQPGLLTKAQILQLLVTLNAPEAYNPAQTSNAVRADHLAETLNIDAPSFVSTATVEKNMHSYSRRSPALFEIANRLPGDSPRPGETIHTTVDTSLTAEIRSMLNTKLRKLQSHDVRNGAVVVVKIPENEILAAVGSPRPRSNAPGNNIDMSTRYRPIGSTLKPFIYLKAFENGARPYSLVEDREYRYMTDLGFPLYPDNFDYEYRGRVTLRYALTNSLNVPAALALKYVGTGNFGNFLKNELGFDPTQPLSEYQLGMALGALEMPLQKLTHYFSVFPNSGILKPLTIRQNASASSSVSRRVASEQHIQLVNAILADRTTGIAQFGLRSHFNLPRDGYALKTGTSRDFRDSWTVGYTPDFVVGVWVGNADTEPTDEITGQQGAGRVWAEVMQLLSGSRYSTDESLATNRVATLNTAFGDVLGLPGDKPKKKRNLLLPETPQLITQPHHNDTFLLEADTAIPLRASRAATWYVNGEEVAQGRKATFRPEASGRYTIRAVTGDRSQTVHILLRE